MNHDVAEVNSFDPRMLPGSFLYEKEPGYEARTLGGAVPNYNTCTLNLRASFLLVKPTTLNLVNV